MWYIEMFEKLEAEKNEERTFGKIRAKIIKIKYQRGRQILVENDYKVTPSLRFYHLIKNVF